MLPCGMVHTGNVAVFVFEHIPRSPAPPYGGDRLGFGAETPRSVL